MYQWFVMAIATLICVPGCTNSPVQQPVRPDVSAKLLNFDAPGKVPGKYFVTLKVDHEVEYAVHEVYLVAPELRPTSKELTIELAAQLGAAVGVSASDIYFGRSASFFVVENASESALQRLASDRRVKTISPVMQTTLN
jgi:hypothetical protein